MKYKIYYGDNSVFTDEDGMPWEAPTLNVQVIWQLQPENILIYGNSSAGRSDLGWFTYREDWGWDIHDMPGLIDYLITYKGPKAILLGRTIPTQDFEKILDNVIKDKNG
jgi:hypothetical protein